EGPGVRRAEFVLGDRHGTTCDPELTRATKNILEDLGYEVKVNDPYAGVELVKAYSNPVSNRHSLQVEIRRDLYMEEESLGKNSNFEKLQNDLETLVAGLSDFSTSL
ncbi:MAG: N-formylglutamate amidohydrolase, partial [Sneathiellales bacterium]|nr:N-formylglutamate amidohydrolase [Sneathiellales bacterium]